MKVKYPYILFAILFAGTVAANKKSVAQQTLLPFVNYSSAQGLIHNRIHVIKQDGKGYMWMGTDMGINRYDGREFRYFAPPESKYRSSRYATVYKDSVIFAVDHFGIVICCGNAARFVRLGHKQIGGMCGVVQTNDSTFFVGDCPHGLYRLKSGRTDPVPLAGVNGEHTITDLYADRAGNVWIMTSVGLALLRHEGAAHPIIIPFFNGQYMTSVNEDKHGDMYVSSPLGLHRYRKADIDHIVDVEPELICPEVPGNITSSAFDAEGNVWLTNTVNGVYKCNPKTKELVAFGIPNGLVSQNTWNVFCDRENNIWIGSETGISKLTSQRYSSINFASNVYQNVKAVCDWDDTTLFFSNVRELFAYQNDKALKIEGYKCYPGYSQQLFLKTPDKRLIVNREELLDPGDFFIRSLLWSVKGNKIVDGSPLKDDKGDLRRIYVESGAYYDGPNMIIQTDRGLMVYSDGKLHSDVFFEKPDVATKAVFLCGDSHGGLWILRAGGDLVRFMVSPRGRGYELQTDETIPAKLFFNDYYSGMFIDSRNRIWLCGRERGMSMVELTDERHLRRVVNFGKDAFSSGIINDITEDKQHNLWVGTAHGLDKIVAVRDTFAVQKDLYGSELCGKYLFFVRAHGDKLFVGTTGCMGVISLGQPDRGAAPLVYITGMKVNNNNADSLLTTQPVFRPNENTFSFVFTGLNFRDEKHVKYSYLLEGLDEDWSTPSEQFTITYLHVPPGTYTFRVKAVSTEDMWSGRQAIFTFTVAQPFYTHLWFLVLTAGFVGSLVYGTYRYRINQVMAIQHIRQNISKDLHDDIGATVSSIQILASMAKSDLISGTKREQFLETIQEESRHVSESLNDIVWSINPKNDSLNVIFVRMRRYASELFEARNISYTFNLPSTFDEDVNMDMRARQHIYLIFKEAVNNLAKYANASEATITFEVAKKRFSMTIEDNGVGFDSSKQSTGNGLLNMKKRASDIDAVLEITSKTGTGTRVSLDLRL